MPMRPATRLSSPWARRVPRLCPPCVRFLDDKRHGSPHIIARPDPGRNRPLEGQRQVLTKSRVVAAVLAVALVLFAGTAEARMGMGGSFGSRGLRTWSSPPVTETAPGFAAPIQRSITP